MENDKNHGPNDIENANTPLVESMKKELNSLSPISYSCCIYRVSERLRMSNDKVYTPQVVSIGPFHHGNPTLKPMEAHKKRYLKSFLERTGVKGLEFYAEAIRRNEAKIRSSYAEPIGLFVGTDELVKMVLVDAGFVTEVLLRSWFDELDRDRDRPWMLQDVFPDLWLLENQLPVFVLEIFLSTVGPGNLSIVDLTHKFFSGLMDFEREWDNLDHVNSSEILHFVDFLTKLYVPLSNDDSDPRGNNKLKTLSIPTASELSQCGVRIEPRSMAANLFEIRFSRNDGVLEMPSLIIGSVTELITRNVLAFEQRHCRESRLNDYVVFLNRLVAAPDDVALLVRQGVFENQLGDHAEVCRLVNKLGDGLIVKFGDFRYANVCEELNEYCRTPWNIWKENLKQKYFNTPWAVVSVIAASLLIVLTIIQAVCSVLSINH